MRDRLSRSEHLCAALVEAATEQHEPVRLEIFVCGDLRNVRQRARRTGMLISSSLVIHGNLQHVQFFVTIDSIHGSCNGYYVLIVHNVDNQTTSRSRTLTDC